MEDINIIINPKEIKEPIKVNAPPSSIRPTRISKTTTRIWKNIATPSLANTTLFKNQGTRLKSPKWKNSSLAKCWAIISSPPAIRVSVSIKKFIKPVLF